MCRLSGLIIAIFVVAAVGGREALVSAATVSCGWENEQSTILGSRDAIIATNVADPDPVHGGLRSLKLVDYTGTATPQAYVAWITGLQAGDVVAAAFWVHDTTGGQPSARIWGHYNNTTNIDTYSGSAYGNYTYSSGIGWEQLDHEWTISPDKTGLVVEVRTYSNYGDTVWIDDMTITAPDHATIRTPELTPGDADGNGMVDAADAALLAANWLTMSDATWAMGDFNGDEKVDDVDAALLAVNWTAEGGAAASTAAVPEPNGIALLIAALAALAAVWRR